MDFRDDIKGYRGAVEHEKLVRDSAFLGLIESIGDFEVVPMTLRHLLILRIMGSPFISGKAPGSVQDIVAFLWLLNPHYDPHGGKAKRNLLRKCAQFAVPAKPWLHTRKAMARYNDRCIQVMTAVTKITAQIRAYLSESLMDWPSSSGDAETTSYYSDVAGLCAVMARDHHFSQEWVLQAPVKVVFQYLKIMRELQGKPLGNPSSKIVSDWLLTQQPADSVIGRMLAEQGVRS